MQALECMCLQIPAHVHISLEALVQGASPSDHSLLIYKIRTMSSPLAYRWHVYRVSHRLAGSKELLRPYEDNQIGFTAQFSIDLRPTQDGQSACLRKGGSSCWVPRHPTAHML